MHVQQGTLNFVLAARYGRQRTKKGRGRRVFVDKEHMARKKEKAQ